jgi:hypothetical protein
MITTKQPYPDVYAVFLMFLGNENRASDQAPPVPGYRDFLPNLLKNAASPALPK